MTKKAPSSLNHRKCESVAKFNSVSRFNYNEKVGKMMKKFLVYGFAHPPVFKVPYHFGKLDLTGEGDHRDPMSSFPRGIILPVSTGPKKKYIQI